MKTDNLIPAAPLDRRELAPGVQLCFTRLDAPLCPPPLDWPRLLVFDFCRSGRRAIPDGAQYAIVTEGHAAVSFAVPGADFYLPGSQYELLRAINTSGAPLTKQRTTGLPCSSVMLWKVAMNL